jgi:serine/threonine protein kinase
MQKFWTTTTKEENSKSFLEIIAQTAFILHHLQNRLRLNHRDVKVNNILIRRRVDPFAIELEGVPMATTYELTLIDFGFAAPLQGRDG